MDNKVNIVIIGTGDISKKRHIPALLQAEHARFYGAFNRTFSHTQAVASEYGVKAYETLDAIWQDRNVQAVLIATPPSSHAPIATAALKAGKHVLLEKPMSHTIEDAEAIQKAVSETGNKLMMLHVQRYYEPHKKAKELLDAGAIGKLLSVRTYLCNGDTALLAGKPLPPWQDALFNVGIHRIDLLRWLIGREVSGVFGKTDCLLAENPQNDPAVNDHAAAILTFEGGITATLVASRVSFHGEDRSTLLIGTEGTVTTYKNGHDVVLEKRTGEKEVFDFGKTTKQGILELTDIHERFCRSILEDTEPEVTALDGVRSVEIAGGIQESSAQGRWIELL